MYRQHLIKMVEKIALRTFRGFGARVYVRDVDAQLQCIWFAGEVA
jgi:hypothetical protein